MHGAEQGAKRGSSKSQDFKSSKASSKKKDGSHRLSTDTKKVSRAGSRRKSGHMQSGMELGATRYRKCQLLNKFR